MRWIELPIGELVARHLAGETVYELGCVYGVSHSTVCNRLRVAGVDMKRGHHERFLPVAEIAARYQAGESTRGLAESYGAAATTIAKRLRIAGVELRKPHWSRTIGGPYSDDGKGYAISANRDGKSCSVHRGCWEAYHGPIPEDHVVHHVDCDRNHNAIENLACMPASEHTALHNHRRTNDNR